MVHVFSHSLLVHSLSYQFFSIGKKFFKFVLKTLHSEQDLNLFIL